MKLDISTITSIASIVYATEAIAVFVQYRINKTYKGYRAWLLGAVLQAIGFLLMPAVNVPSIWMLSILANPSVFIGQIMLNVGIAEFLEKKEERWVLASIAVAFILAYAYFIVIDNSIQGRAVVVSVMTAVISLKIALLILRGKAPNLSSSADFSASVFLAYGGFEIAMTVVSLVLPPLGSYYEISKSPIRMVSFIIPIVVSMLWTFGFILMVNQRLNAENREEREKMRVLLAEKELILKDVHHRIKNNMSTMSGLLSLQAGSLKDPVAVSALGDAGNRIQSMMLLYDKLYKSTAYGELSIAEYLSSLIDDIVSNFANAGAIRVEKKLEDFVLEVRLLQPLGLIVNELLTNIMKYAFAGRAQGIITVSASLEDGLVSLAIADDGSGMPESIDFENSSGFGILLVKALTQQIKGSIGIERGSGTRILLEFRR
jgi:two-component sensor histidine kinase